jgi:hypothetical protein
MSYSAPNKLLQPRSLPPVAFDLHWSFMLCGRAPAERWRWGAKMSVRTFVVSLCLLTCAGCAVQPAIDAAKPPDVSQAETRSLMIGTWYGDAPTKDGGRRLQITRRAADGTFQVMFRVISASGEVAEQTEVGFWGVSASVYFTITRGWLHGERFSEADPEDASLNDAYQILELSSERFRYRALQSGSEYSLTRVPDSFTFPSE